MLNFQRIFAFLFRVLAIMLPFLVMVAGLGFLTEWLTSEVPVQELIRTGRFWLSVAVDMIPAIVVMLVALWIAGRFVHGVYKLENWLKGFWFILYSRCGQPGFAPWLRIQRGVAEPAKDKSLTQIGGPGHLVVYNDTAVVLERAGRLTRVESGGFPCLESFERIYEVIDLRPKQYNYRVSAITQDGIPIHWDAKIRYQIDQGDEEPTPKKPYPFSEDAVLKAATRKWHREPSWRFGQDMDWEGMIVVSRAEGELRSILARYTLDQLIGVRPGEEQAVREEVQAKLKEKLDGEAPKFGARILEVRLDNLGVQDHVTQQWIKAWKSRWQRWAAGRLAPGEATYVYLQEVTKAEAQVRLVRSITEALGRQMAGDRISPQMVNRIVLLRLFSVMDRAGLAASARVFFPSSAADMLERMRGMLLPNDIATPPAQFPNEEREEET